MRKYTVAVVLLVMSALSGLGSHAAEPTDALEIASFEFLGCSGDWDDEEYSPEVTRLSSIAGTTFLVRHPETCGADAARNPKASLKGGVLELNYEPYSSTDIYAMCPCEYWAKFTLKGPAMSARSATFRAKPVRLKGSWPER